MYPNKILTRIGDVGLIAVIRGESRAAALEVSELIVGAGVEGIEVAYTTPEAHQVIWDLANRHDDILLGVGTVTTPEQVEKSVAAGASFVVSPGIDPEIVSLAGETGLAIVPGVFTPSEIMVAHRCGLTTVKLFPGSFGGPSYLKSLGGPFPETSFIPTGGVTLGNIDEWFAAGAFAVGIGSALAPATLDPRKRDEVVIHAKKLVEATRIAKSKYEE